MSRTLAGRVLVTSRLGEGWHRLNAEVVRLDILSEAEAIDLLTRIAAEDRPDADLTGAAELVAELGHLPLAVEQAASYLHQNHLTPRAYLDLLGEHPAVMYDQTARGADAERTIARIWRLTLNELTDVPLAATLLRVLAWYGPEPIPRSLLDGVVDPPRVQEALGALAAYSMVSIAAETVTVHPLVQAVARTPDSGDPYRRSADVDGARDQAAVLLAAALPGEPLDPGNWPWLRALSPHVDALARTTPADADTRITAHLLNEIGIFVREQGDSERAIAYYQRAAAASDRVLGADHPDALTSRNNLATAYGQAGDLRRAIPLLEHTLAAHERVQGIDHPRTLRSRNNLASAYESAGDLERAVPLHERTLAERERVLGVDHPDTLLSRSNLAYAYQAAGDLERAVPLHERALADCERVLGVDHPDTLRSRNNLAGAYKAVGGLERAVSLYKRTLADCERVLGADQVASTGVVYEFRLVEGVAS